MPTLYKAKLTESETPWLESWDRIYWELLPKSVPILTLLGFYAERDLPIPDADPARDLTNDEKTELGRIATSLTIAAAASEAMPIGVLIATLKKVSDNPSLFFSGQLSGEVEWVIARNYRRSDEKAAANWRDVWGNQPPQFEGQIEVPTEDNIARAALSAVSRIQNARRRGRPYNTANRILAEGLAPIFRTSGLPIVRRLRSDTRHGETVFNESGPFCDFLELVLPPLQRHLREQDLAPVTIDTIVRLVTEDFPSA
jgi:hypothetical protein